MTDHETILHGAATSHSCPGVICAPHHFMMKIVLLALFVGVAGSWAYCEAGQSTSLGSSLDMSDAPAAAATY